MDTLRLLVVVVLGALGALVRRIAYGPRHPGWTPALDAIVGAMRASFGQIAVLGAARYRRASERLAPLITAGVPCRAVHDGPLVGHWLEPADAGELVIVYLHGGGYCFGSIRTHGNLAGHLAIAAKARIFLPDYPLAPEHPLPAARDHAVAAVRALVAQGVAPERLVLAGDSAGGHLVFTALMALREGGPRLAGGVAISPWTDLSNSGESFVRNDGYDYCRLPACAEAAGHALGGADPREHAPLHADLTGLPPVLVHAGGAECLVDQITALGEHAARQGADVEVVVWPGMVHVWHMLVDATPEARHAIDAIAAWAHARTG